MGSRLDITNRANPGAVLQDRLPTGIKNACIDIRVKNGPTPGVCHLPSQDIATGTCRPGDTGTARVCIRSGLCTWIGLITRSQLHRNEAQIGSPSRLHR